MTSPSTWLQRCVDVNGCFVPQFRISAIPSIWLHSRNFALVLYFLEDIRSLACYGREHF
ncbi:hypothetical protein M404DRAFT_1001626, partial [Pisolithus tinctorius Marx 270]